MFKRPIFANQIPPSVKSFLLKITVLFFAWEFLYLVILQPLHFPDEMITNFIGSGTSFLLSFIFPQFYFDHQSIQEGLPGSIKSIVLVNGMKLIGIADGCNAFELQVLYLGVLICLQKLNQKTIWYILVGVPLISLGNIFRCSIIGWLNITQHLKLSAFAHHYLFKIIMYGLIFLGWISYTNESEHHAES